MLVKEMRQPEEALRRFVRRFPSFFSFLETTIYLIFTLTFPGIVVFGMMYVALLYDGLIAWLFGAALLTPIVFFWYYKMQDRIRNYVKLLYSQGKFKWNVDKAVNEFLQIVQEQQKTREEK